jgi:Cft2 family RNA processing exonuclease
MARHECAFCTPLTGDLYLRKFGPRMVRTLPYGKPLQLGTVSITAVPAGHCRGSAMLLADDGQTRLLYTGDFKLGPSATSERAELPQADVLVIESTFGDPRYRLPPREIVVEQLIEIVTNTLVAGRTPVIEAYVMGKSQEVSALLAAAGIPVLQHPLNYEITEHYRRHGLPLENVHCFTDGPLPGHAVVVPPRMQKAARLPGLSKSVTIAVSGWAYLQQSRWRLGADHALPLSDHADYDELIEAVERVNPRLVLCTHGPVGFVNCLRELGHNAHRLEEAPVMAAL